MLNYFSRLAVVLVEIADGKHNVDQDARNRLDTLVADMAAEGARVDALQVEVTADEGKEAGDVLGLGDRMTNLEARVTDLDGKETVLEAKVADVIAAEANLESGLSGLTDTLEAASAAGNTLVGGQGADSINTGGTDSVVAPAGADTALGGQGNDVIQPTPVAPVATDTGAVAPEVTAGPVLGTTVTATPETPTAAAIAADDPSLVVSAPGEPLAVVTDDPAIVAQTVTPDSTHDSVIVTDHPDGSQLVTPVLSNADDIAVGDVVVDPATATPAAAPVDPAA